MSSSEQLTTYGPSALATPANAITLVRIGLAPVLVMVLISAPDSLLPAWMWAGLALSDGADGYIARRQGVTRSGAFLDPLADKLLVFSVFAALWFLHRVSGMPVLIMGVRELLVSAYRTQVLASGRSLPARIPGKLKMVVQIVVIGMALIPAVATHDAELINVAAWIATVLAVVSGIQYFTDSRSIKA